MQNLDKYIVEVKGKEKIKLEIQYDHEDLSIAIEIQKNLHKILQEKYQGNYSITKNPYSKKIEEVQD